MSRLPDAPALGPVADAIRERRRGRLHPLDRALLHSPPAAAGWNAFLGAVRGELSLAPDVRELVILRVAVLNDAGYEWAAHVGPAREAGVGDAELAAVRLPDAASAFTGPVAAALAYVDAMTRDVQVDDEVFDALRTWLDERQLLELTVTAAAYNMVSRVVVALRIGAEPAGVAP